MTSPLTNLGHPANILSLLFFSLEVPLELFRVVLHVLGDLMSINLMLRLVAHDVLANRSEQTVAISWYQH